MMYLRYRVKSTGIFRINGNEANVVHFFHGNKLIFIFFCIFQAIWNLFQYFCLHRPRMQMFHFNFHICTRTFFFQLNLNYSFVLLTNMTCASSAVFDQVHQVLFNRPHFLQYSCQNGI